MNDNVTHKTITTGRKKLDPMHKRTLRREITLNSIENLKCVKLMQLHNLASFRDLFDKLVDSELERNIDKVLELTLLPECEHG